MRSTRRAAPTTFIPWLARVTAVEAPIPALAPVTMATLPFQRLRDNMVSYFQGLAVN